jgi:hypothetical protein
MLEYDPVVGSSYNSDGMMYFREALTAINAAVETRRDESAAPGMMRAIVNAQLPMPLVREKYMNLQPATMQVAAQSGVAGAARVSRPVYSFNPNRRRY